MKLKLNLLLMLGVLLLPVTSKTDENSTCEFKDFDQSKYIVKSGTGSTYESALNEALIGVDRVTEAALLSSDSHLVQSSKDGAVLINSHGKLKAVWIDNFITKSCRDGYQVKVLALFPKQEISYYRLPKNYTFKSLSKMDEGLGVAIYHWHGKKPRLIASTGLCSTEGDLICAFPVRQYKYYLAEDKTDYYQLGPGAESKRGHIDAVLYSQGSPSDITSYVLSELIRRSQGKAGTGALRSTVYDELN